MALLTLPTSCEKKFGGLGDRKCYQIIEVL